MSPGAMINKFILPAAGLLTAVSLLLIFALQYPLSTTFPIGGDAASHIRAAQTVLASKQAPAAAITLLKHSNYPLSHPLLAAWAALPLSWPDRFVWWITVGHILTGFSIGALLWRVGSWRAAAAGLAIWALSPVGINNHFEDGTAPQLWSLIFLILTFERLAAGSTWGTLAMVAATVGTHLLSGFVLIASLIMGTVLLLPVRHRLAPHQATLIKYLGALTALLAGLAIYKYLRGPAWPFIEQQSEDFFLLDILKSKFAPWLVLSIPGIAILISKLRHSLPASTSLLSFFWLAFLLTTNSTLRVGLWENRFRTYFIVAVCLAAGLSLPHVSRSAFRSPAARLLFLGLLFTTLTALTWRDNSAVYRFYEDPSRNARLHPEVISAINWLGTNLPLTSFIASSSASRDAEWIPVLTPLNWQALNDRHTLLTDQDGKLLTEKNTDSFTHIIFLTQQESVNATMLAHPDLFPIVFQNPSAVIIKLP